MAANIKRWCKKPAVSTRREPDITPLIPRQEVHAKVYVMIVVFAAGYLFYRKVLLCTAAVMFG